MSNMFAFSSAQPLLSIYPKSVAISLVRTRKQRRPYLYRSRQLRFRPVFKAILIPPASTLAICATVSTLPFIPPIFQNAPASFLLSALFSNIGLIPTDSMLYSRIFDLAPYGISLLLFQKSDEHCAHPLASCSPRLLLAFVIGSLGTTVGALVTALVLRTPHLALLAAAFTATYVGGSINFIAVAKALSIPTYLATAAMAADMLAMAIYFTFLFAVAARIQPKLKQNTSDRPKSIQQSNWTTRFIKPILSLPIPLGVTILLALLSKSLVHWFGLPYVTELLIMSVLSLTISSVPAVSRYLQGASFAATICLNLFFAALGSTAKLSAAFSVSWQISIFCASVLVIHGAIMFLVCRYIFRIPLYEILIASNANVGGASTAAAFAASTGGQNLVAGALAIGTLGYLFGTPLGLCVYHILSP